MKREGQLPASDEPLLDRLKETEQRLAKLEKENHDLSTLCAQVQDQNEALTNLYVASQRLHATLDPSQVLEIVPEILFELVGAEQFGILILDERKEKLQLVAGKGVTGGPLAATILGGDGVIGKAALGQSFFLEGVTSAPGPGTVPLAAVPLNFRGNAVGVIAIYKLLGQKKGFSAVDVELLQLLADHAATALVTARLHAAVSRKLKTIEGFIKLMREE
jgi:GAF domain-containing protein